MVDRFAQAMGRRLATLLNKPLKHYHRLDVIDEDEYRTLLRPGDVILVEGDRRLSAAIKYLTQSTWSHACIYIGGILHTKGGKDRLELIEADIEHGVIAVPLSKYINHNTRIARPIGLSRSDRKKLLEFVVAHLGHRYDLKNVTDLLRYLLPQPPVPGRFRRRLLAFGSGDPTRAICSTLLAQAFQSIRYPILPRRGFQCVTDASEVTDEEILRARHYSQFTPRDFDLSPYFAIIKPTIERKFDYKKLKWQRDQVEEPPDGVIADAGSDDA